MSSASGSRRSAGGFTLIELMMALTVLIIGIGGILVMHLSALHATAYSRHATEAAVLAEDKMEEIRTQPTAALVDGSEDVTAAGAPASPEELSFNRAWTIAWNGALGDVNVTVSWLEGGNEPHAVALRTQRAQ